MAVPSNGKKQTFCIPPDEDDSIEFEGLELSKPCQTLEYCPYGPLVEQFPLLDKRDDMSCRIFGHQCPVFYTAEMFVDFDVVTEGLTRPSASGNTARATTEKKGVKPRSPRKKSRKTGDA
jgi:hypothetical protein